MEAAVRPRSVVSHSSSKEGDQPASRAYLRLVSSDVRKQFARGSLPFEDEILKDQEEMGSKNWIGSAVRIG